MKYLLIFLCLFGEMVYSQNNCTSYGVVGDGVADDSISLQNCFDNETNISLNTGTYFISKRLEVDRPFNQTINGNGSTFIVNNNLNDFMFSVNKVTGVAYVSNIIFEANKLARHGIELSSSFDMDNVDLFNVYEDDLTAGCYGYRINMDVRLMSIAKLNNVDVNDVESVGNGTIAEDAIGASKPLFIYWNTASFNNHLEINNSNFSNSYGDDGDVCDIYEFPLNTNTKHSTTFNNCSFRYGQRRIVKCRSNYVTFNNSIFEAASFGNPRITTVTPHAGLFVASNVNSETSMSQGIEVNNCTFIGTDYMDNVIPSRTNDFNVSNSYFINSDLTPYREWGNIYVSGTNFDSDSNITSYGHPYVIGEEVYEGGFLNGAGFGDFKNTGNLQITLPVHIKKKTPEEKKQESVIWFK